MENSYFTSVRLVQLKWVKWVLWIIFKELILGTTLKTTNNVYVMEWCKGMILQTLSLLSSISCVNPSISSTQSDYGNHQISYCFKYICLMWVSSFHEVSYVRQVCKISQDFELRIKGKLPSILQFQSINLIKASVFDWKLCISKPFLNFKLKWKTYRWPHAFKSHGLHRLQKCKDSMVWW